jgi:hypothetical protein
VILALDLAEASAKVRAGGPKDVENDLGHPAWAGEVPLRTAPLPAVPAADLEASVPVPPYARDYRRPGW